MSENKMIPLTGLWKKTSAKGNTYLVGRLGLCRVMVMANKNCQGEKDPTHHILISPYEDRNNGAQGGGNGGHGGGGYSSQQPAAPAYQQPALPETSQDDDIPF